MTTIGKALTEALGPDRVAEDADALARHSKDYWILAHLRARQGRLGKGPACVVRPHNTAEVATAITLAQRHGVSIVPYGLGSGVVGGATPPAGALVIDLSALNRVLELHEESLYARVQAGKNGAEYEAEIAQRGYTSGHYPQSIGVSSVGGWVATRAAGQFSTKYGNIEDICLGLEAVLPSGQVVQMASMPRAAIGPNLRELFLGSEGTLGIITEVTLRLFAAAEKRASESYAFGDLRTGLDVIRRVIRRGWRPACVRLYDALETGRNFGEKAPSDKCLLLIISEGPAAMVEGELAAFAAEARTAHGEQVGPAPVTHWMEHRNTVPSWDFFLEREMIVDTVEVASTWDRIAGIYDAVIASLNVLPGVVAASAHSSHSYPQGTNLYFTFALKPVDWAKAEDVYLEAWHRTLTATHAGGGTISHHHGIGRLRSPYLKQELGSAYQVLLDIKRALDPKGLMNPGVLIA